MFKHLSISALLLCCSSAFAQESADLSIYLCSRLSPEARAWNDVVCRDLGEGFSLFRPQDIDFTDVPEYEIDYVAYREDFAAMNGAQALLVLPSYGRDCAWEIGWFCGQGKPAIAYAEIPGDWMRDGMVKGGLTAIITANASLHAALTADPLLKEKAHFIPSRELLGEKIRSIVCQEDAPQLLPASRG